MRRFFDIAVSLFLLALLSVPMALIALLVKLSSEGPVLYWSDRVGMDNRIFKMPKFRTMRIGTPEVATHLIQAPERYLTPCGSFLRKFSIDELPQIWSILKGDMSLIGPRPALYNQDDLIALRTEKGVHRLVPGVTGWAQVNGLRGDTSIAERTKYDVWYIENWSLWLDFKIILRTLTNFLGDRHAY